MFANNVPVVEYIRDSYTTEACHRIRCSMVFQSTRCARTYRPGLVHPKLVWDITVAHEAQLDTDTLCDDDDSTPILIQIFKWKDSGTH